MASRAMTLLSPGANPSNIASVQGANSRNYYGRQRNKASTVLGAVYNGNIYAYQKVDGREVKSIVPL